MAYLSHVHRSLPSDRSRFFFFSRRIGRLQQPRQKTLPIAQRSVFLGVIVAGLACRTGVIDVYVYIYWCGRD